MSVVQDRAAYKQMIRDRLMQVETEALELAKAHHEEFLRESQLDRTETVDKDEVAASRENADLAAAFDGPVLAHHAKIDVIENMDFSLKDTVQPGAAVILDGLNFVVAVSTEKFDVDGRAFMGISTQSPIYKAMEGLGAGDTFTHAGKEYEIQDVL
ncbi:hypothetical protein [Jhaorihella thermophila]|uniref:Transcription elongation factor, GreA/GreB family n=1 Tax=Jhaorihella thermophila TaxID=488547 RepID=A0A1H5T0N6_9RHOB|nr:hypothetical protein [Jhaorihella thermophila]SEF56345.1 hypothetical protein SAMN05421751_10210 [Jhaorihella thermophila]